MNRFQFWCGLACGIAATLVASRINTDKSALAAEEKKVDTDADSKEDPMLYELRTYHTPEGKLDALNARFRNHTLTLFEKHGMKNIMYWTPIDKPNTLAPRGYAASSAASVLLIDKRTGKSHPCHSRDRNRSTRQHQRSQPQMAESARLSELGKPRLRLSRRGFVDNFQRH